MNSAKPRMDVPAALRSPLSRGPVPRKPVFNEAAAEAAAAAAPDTVEHFLSKVAVLMGWGPGDAERLSGGKSFKGPADLFCRLHVQDSPEGLRARPDVLLSMAAAEMSGRDVVRFLTLQASLFSEGVWFLGMSSEGFLQLSALKWFDEPGDVVAALDVANAISLAVLRAILQVPVPQKLVATPGSKQ